MSQADHLHGLEEKVRHQAETIKNQRAVEAFRARQLDALHYVWCSGGCASGIHRYGPHPPLTQILVDDALGCVKRMVEKLRALDYRAGYPNGYATLTGEEAEDYTAIVDAINTKRRHDFYRGRPEIQPPVADSEPPAPRPEGPR